jgi:uncharacterized phage protein (TIGR01671 family)
MDEAWSVDTRLGLVETPKWKLSICEPKDVELMQFTGLLDKNGKEIYEGDILENMNWREWNYKNGEKHRVVVKWTSGKKFSGFGIGEDTHYEIIGNIYENPELLSQ